jgi:hypothetical protein
VLGGLKNVSGKAITALVGLMVTGIAIALWASLTASNETIASQLDLIRHRAALDGQFAVVDRTVELRGDGIKSRLFVFREHVAPGLLARRSDELQIYDETGNRLHLAFDFAPSASSDNNRGYRFTLENVADLAGTDRSEIIGSYATQFMNASVPRPVVVDWDESLNHYRIDALLSHPLDLDKNVKPDFYGQAAQGLYQAKTLVDRKHHLSLPKAYGTEAFTVKRGKYPLLLAVFVVHAKDHAEAPLLQLRGWQLNFEAPTPQVGSCAPDNEQPILFVPQSFKDLEPANLERRWNAATNGFIDCE